MSNTTKQYVDLDGITVYDEEIKNYIGEEIDDTSISDLKDVSINSPTNGQSLVYNSTAQRWENSSSSGGVALSSLTDTNISSETDGQVLKYNGTSQKWENGSLDLSTKYDTNDSAETALDDTDYMPFYDTSATAKKKTLWSNIKSVLKSYFDTLYQSVLTLPLSIANGGTGNDAGYIQTGSTGVPGPGCTVEGSNNNTYSMSQNSHSEGSNNKVGGQLGGMTYGGDYSHAEGRYNEVYGNHSHVEGFHNYSEYNNQHVQGYYNNNKSNTLLEVGNGTLSARSNAFEVYDDGSLSQDNGTSKFKFTQSNGADGYYDASGTFHAFGSGGSSDWSDVTNKPFSTVNAGSFTATSDDLRLAGNRVESLSRYASDGGSSTQGYRGITANYKTPTGVSGTSSAIVEYVMKHGTTSATTTYTFSNTPTNTNMLIDVYSSIYGETPSSVTTPTTTSVAVTFAESKARTVAIVLK